jgi:hypothetical protein
MRRTCVLSLATALIAACGAPIEPPAPGPDLLEGAASDGGATDGGRARGDLGPIGTPETKSVSLLAGSPGMVGADDGTGSGALFQHPVGAAFDGADTLYIADTDNHVIRALALSTKRVTTLAGKAGELGSVDGTGDQARFTAPQGLVVVGGALYIADTDAHAIRRLDLTTREVTTLAGRLMMDGAYDAAGAAARFRFPKGLVADGTAALYVADAYNHAIRKVTLPDGVVSTFAGRLGTQGATDGRASAARFDTPQGVALDDAGTLYVADTFNDAIRAVALETADVTTIAGMPGSSGFADGVGAAARWNGPRHLAFDGALLYVTDTYNAVARAVIPPTGAVTTIAGSPSSMMFAPGSPGALERPSGIAVLSPGRLALTDWRANVILLLD